MNILSSNLSQSCRVLQEKLNKISYIYTIIMTYLKLLDLF